MASERVGDDLYLGIDVSTTGIKVAACTDDGHVAATASVRFDDDLPQYGTYGGVHTFDDGRVSAPLAMYVDGLVLALDRAAERFGANAMAAVAGLGLCAAQHSVVLLATDDMASAAGDDAPNGARIVAECAASADVPSWMDASPEAVAGAAVLAEAAGGRAALAARTGSPPSARFSGPQLWAVRTRSSATLKATAHVRLLSAALTSVLAGKLVANDAADGSGTHLLELSTRAWASELCEAAAPGLEAKLGPVADGCEAVGRVAPWLVARYGLRADVLVAPGTGDNPSVVAGLGLSRTQVALSLGTSDTLLGLSDAVIASDAASVFCAPEPANVHAPYMALLVCANGSRTRARLARALVAETESDEAAWAAFDAALADAQLHGRGYALFADVAEILPPTAAGPRLLPARACMPAAREMLSFRRNSAPAAAPPMA